MAELFDFNRHYVRIRQAATSEETADIRKEYDAHYEALSESEKEIFTLRLREHARQESIRTKALIDFVKEVLGTEQQAV